MVTLVQPILDTKQLSELRPEQRQVLNDLHDNLDLRKEINIDEMLNEALGTMSGYAESGTDQNELLFRAQWDPSVSGVIGSAEKEERNRLLRQQSGINPLNGASSSYGVQLINIQKERAVAETKMEAAKEGLINTIDDIQETFEDTRTVEQEVINSNLVTIGGAQLEEGFTGYVRTVQQNENGEYCAYNYNDPENPTLEAITDQTALDEIQKQVGAGKVLANDAQGSDKDLVDRHHAVEINIKQEEIAIDKKDAGLAEKETKVKDLKAKEENIVEKMENAQQDIKGSAEDNTSETGAENPALEWSQSNDLQQKLTENKAEIAAKVGAYASADELKTLAEEYGISESQMSYLEKTLTDMGIKMEEPFANDLDRTSVANTVNDGISPSLSSKNSFNAAATEKVAYEAPKPDMEYTPEDPAAPAPQIGIS